MTSQHAIHARWAPSQTEIAPPDPLLSTLHRLRVLLGVESASLTRVDADRLRVLAAVGATDLLTDLQPLQLQTLRHTGPLIIADTTSQDIAAPVARFYAGLILPAGDPGAPLLLSLVDRQPRSPAMAYRLAALAIDVTSAATIARQARQITVLRSEQEQEREMFNLASQTARIGVWACDLADNSLTWTDSVYDLFELPRGAPLERAATVECYTAASRIAMEAARAKAIAECSDFCVDAEIITAKGTRRWMRLTGSVEAHDGVARRIFGMKQDITEEKLLADRTRYLAETDVMTGLANRSQFQNQLADLSGVTHGAPVTSLLLIDLDGFKQINDTHGHAVGDDCLKEAAARLVACCQGAALVARIGGDEFAVLPAGDHGVADLDALGQCIVHAVGGPYLRNGQTITLSASVGVALNTGGSPEDLFRKADIALYAAKAAGRNTMRRHAD